MSKLKKHRSFLKWAGGKFNLVEPIRAHLPDGKRLVEPFVGAGSVFLNTDFEHYWLNDINPDLIDLYRWLQQDPELYIEAARLLFVSKNNEKQRYLDFRAEFNECQAGLRRSTLFLYLNRFGYNGLCRYNKKGGFNVPFGRYKRPYFPENELRIFAAKANRATLTCLPFEDVFAKVTGSDVVYCDPPYAPLSATASFTSYAGNGFSSADQLRLAECAWQCSNKEIPVLISNHDLASTRQWYHQAQLSQLDVRRTISRNGKGRAKVSELLALYHVNRS